jgi:hypothetical protein
LCGGGGGSVVLVDSYTSVIQLSLNAQCLRCTAADALPSPSAGQ